MKNDWLNELDYFEKKKKKANQGQVAQINIRRHIEYDKKMLWWTVL